MTWKKKVLYAAGSLVILLLGASAWVLGPALLPAEQVNAGIAKGAKAPITIELHDHGGKLTTLAEKMGRSGMVLYLVRSADWCLFCKAQLARTNEIVRPLQDQGYSVVSVSYDKPEILAEFAGEKQIAFGMLSDDGSRLIDALGLRDPQYPAGHFAAGVPRASTLVLSPDGTVKARFVAKDYRSRISNDEVLAMVKQAAP